MSITPARSQSTAGSRHRAQHAKPSLLATKGAPLAVSAALGAGVMVLGIGTAHAASADDFARLRQCESGGNYSINTGNGYSGAYQFSAGTWRSLGFGGLPYQASPATQDQAARQLQARSGWGQWPACSRKLGLRNGSPSAAAAPAPAPAPPTPVPAPDVPKASPGSDVAVEAPQVARNRSLRTPQAVAPRAVTYKVLARDVARAYVVPTTAPAFAPQLVVLEKQSPSFSPEVKAWQARMAQRGWTIAVDGYFGPQSASVAQRFATEKKMAQGPVVVLDKTVFDGAWTAPVTAP